MRKNLLFIAILALSAVNVVKSQTVYFNGLGRAVVTNDKLGGLALDPDTLNSKPDTANVRRGTGGYTLFDLGINAQPGENLRASAILRIRNEFGGFYGDGSSLVFRQLRLDGVLNKVVKYEIGDIDLSMTPYTMYNFSEIYHDYEADIFGIRRAIVQYENFNFGNNWRVQGAHATTAIKFPKYVEKLGFGGFASRTRRSNYFTLPDRVLIGGEIDLTQSKYVHVGLNYTKYYDLPNTAPSPVTDFSNSVTSVDYKLQYEFAEKIGVSLYGEIGNSNYRYDTNRVEVSKSGGISETGFYDLGASVKYNPLNIKLFGSYRYVAPFFSSPAAQTRRIYDYFAPSTFPTVGNNFAAARTPLLFDRLAEEGSATLPIRNVTIMPFLMEYLPHYNNITPYGIATPNRQGLTFGISAGGEEQAFTADFIVDNLSEVVGEGTGSDDNKRQFFGLKGGASIALNKLFKFEKIIVVNGGFRHENTERTANPISLTSTLIDAGLTIEVVKQLDLLVGYKTLTAEGNEFLSVRDNFNLISGYRTFEINSSQDVLAAGFRYRFSKNTFFTAQGHWVDFTDNQFKFNNYKINQLFLSYTMVF